jgi:hypothetical protein
MMIFRHVGKVTENGENFTTSRRKIRISYELEKILKPFSSV